MSQPAPPAPPRADLPVTATAPFTGSPDDPRVLSGLRQRRDVLTGQLEGAVDRRNELARELSNTSMAEGAIRRGLEQRLEVLDERVVQIERDLVATDRQLAGAPPQLLAETAEPRVVHTGPDDEDLAAFGAGGFVLGLLVMLVGSRVRRWRRRGERGAARAAAEAAGPDPRIDRLAHAVDAIAVEVERIGEGQRFVTQLLAESRAPQAALPADPYAGRPARPEYAAASPTQDVPGGTR